MALASASIEGRTRAVADTQAHPEMANRQGTGDELQVLIGSSPEPARAMIPGMTATPDSPFTDPNAIANYAEGPQRQVPDYSGPLPMTCMCSAMRRMGPRCGSWPGRSGIGRGWCRSG